MFPGLLYYRGLGSIYADLHLLAKNHFLSEFLFSSLKLHSGSSVQEVCESLWICFHGTKSRKVTSDTVCTLMIILKCSLHALFWPWDNLSLSLGFINNYLVWCYWMLKKRALNVVAFQETSSRKINILSFISNQTVSCLASFVKPCAKSLTFLGPSWEVDRDSGPLQHFLRVPRGRPGEWLWLWLVVCEGQVIQASWAWTHTTV